MKNAQTDVMPMQEKGICAMWPISLETMKKYIYEDGLSDYRIAERFGKKEHAVRHLRGKYGLSACAEVRRLSKADLKLKWPPTGQTLERFKAKGLSDRKIAARYGVSASMIVLLRQRYEVEGLNLYAGMQTKRPWPAPEPELRALFEKLYKHSTGKARVAPSIARLYGVSATTVRRRLGRLGIGGYALRVQTRLDAAFKALLTFRYDDPYPAALLDCLDGALPRIEPRRSCVSSTLAA